jgi:hypothetical protein
MDLSEYLAGPMIIPTAKHPLTQESLPVILGHEISGTIVEVGSDVTSLSSGDEVAVFPLLCDSTCSVCLQGRPNCCRNFGSIGFSGQLWNSCLPNIRINRLERRSWWILRVSCGISGKSIQTPEGIRYTNWW